MKINVKDIKMIVADIDGTLTNINRVLTPKTKEVIQRLKNHNVEFALASGRPVDEIEYLVERWGCEQGFFTYYIGMNGGELKDFNDQKSEAFFKIEPEHIKEILEIMAPFDINPCVYYHGNVLCKRIDERVQLSINRTKKKAIVYQDVSELYAEPNAKVLFRLDPTLMDECEAYAKKHPSPYWNIFRTGPFCLEFGDSRINKAYPLSIIAKKYGYTFDQMIAFGDTSNDNEMMQAVGWSVCMANGTVDTKKLSNDITRLTANEDGLAIYIEEHILNKFGD